MRSRSRSPWPQRTTAVGGGLLAVTGLLQLDESARWQLPITELIVVPLSGPPVAVAAAIIRAVAFGVLAMGIARETGVVAQSSLGRLALLLWGIQDVVGITLPWALPDVQQLPAVGYLLLGVQLLFLAAALTASVVVLRARVIHGAAAWTFLVLALVDLVFAVLSNPLPGMTEVFLAVLQVLAAMPLEFLQPVLTLLLACTLLLWGRLEALKHRAKVIHDAW